MVFVGHMKYACETCIKGHRSSTCKHTDRPLFEIKKKGRPVTQCDHCRELRKTKQVHVKCICESKDDNEGLSSSQRGVKKLPVSATFPSGLPEALEASVALQLLSEGSDSEHGSVGTVPNICTCKADGPCTCWTPRSGPSRSKRVGKERMTPLSADDTTTQPDDDSSTQITRPAGLAVIANSGEYRPVLPRPSPQRPSSPTGPVHDPSQYSSVHAGRHQIHHYSPYGRAYEYTHTGESVSERLDSNSPIPQLNESSSLSVPVPQNYQGQHGDSTVSVTSWLDSISSYAATAPRCGCGSGCECPGCVIHRGYAAVPSAFGTCVNPGACSACLDCNMLSLPVTIPPNTPLSQYDLSQIQSIDDWIRQMSSSVGTPSSGTDLSADPSHSEQPAVPAQQDIQFDPALWQTYALWNSFQRRAPAQSAPQECCGGNCKCPGGMCACAADCCGCCQGCQCSECNHEEEQGSSSRLTFAVSGERAACCGDHRSTHDHGVPQPLQPAYLTSSTSMVASGSGSEPNAYGDWSNPAMSLPRTTLSRASSPSSRSSSPRSHSSSSQGSIHAIPSATTVDVQALRSCCTSMQNMGTSSQSNILSPSQHHPSSNTSPQHRTLIGTEFHVNFNLF